jgi:hypothetical protein
MRPNATYTNHLFSLYNGGRAFDTPWAEEQARLLGAMAARYNPIAALLMLLQSIWHSIPQQVFDNLYRAGGTACRLWDEFWDGFRYHNKEEPVTALLGLAVFTTVLATLVVLAIKCCRRTLCPRC